MFDDTEVVLEDRNERQIDQEDEDAVLPEQLQDYSFLKHYR